jgi:hypothetical protein
MTRVFAPQQPNFFISSCSNYTQAVKDFDRCSNINEPGSVATLLHARFGLGGIMLAAGLNIISLTEHDKAVRSAGRAVLPTRPLKNSASRPRPAQHGQSPAFTEVVELLVDVGCLDAVGLVCLGSCSRAHKIAAEAVLKRRAMFLLRALVQQAAAAERSMDSSRREKSAKAVEGLVKDRRINSSLLTARTAAAQFISISNVPQPVVKALMEAGLRFTYEQLMQAVRARTAGVEVWVTAKAGITLPRVKRMQTVKWASLPSWIQELCTFRSATLVSSIILQNVF